MGANILDALNCYFPSWKTEIFTEKYKKIAITKAEESSNRRATSRTIGVGVLDT